MYLIGKKIIIRYDPTNPAKEITISYDGKFYGEAKLVDAFANRKVKRANNKGFLEINEEQEKSQFCDEDEKLKLNNSMLLGASEIDMEEEEKDEN